MILGIVALGFASCSKETLSYAERDTALNLLRANKWYDVVKYYDVNGANTSDTLVGDKTTEYIEFRANDFAYIMQSDKNFGPAIPYSMPEKQVLIFDGVTYQIEQSLIGGLKQFSGTSTTNGKTDKIVFKRR